ncbi:MAG: ABC transporter permease [Burkholderiaceae bacterium]|nr:ABC transporter permease [Microbacteriaceae bacterium]
MKAMDILGTAVGNSFRSRLRTTLTVLAIFIGAFTLTITNALGTGINNYITTQISSIGAPDVMTVFKPTAVTAPTDGPAPYEEGGGSELATNQGPPGSTVIAMTDADLATIAAIPGITSADAIIAVRPDFVEWQDNGKFQLSVSEFSAGITLDLAAGSGFDQTGGALQIVLPTTYVPTLGFASNAAAVGQTVSIGVTDAIGTQHLIDATVVGVQNPTLIGSGASTNNALTTAIFDAQRTGLPASTPTEYASATARFDAGASASQITAIKDDLTAAGFTGSTVADQIGTFQTVVDGIILVLNGFAVIALIAAGFGIINTLLMSVQERTREIGLMKAMGMSGGRIFALFSTEAVFIGFLGSAIGAGVAIAVGALVSNVLAEGFLSGLVGLQILTFAPASIATVFALVMGIAFLASTLPASRAARQSPIDSLRYE